MISIYVLDNGELFRQLLNASSSFIYSAGFKSVLAISAFFGIFLTLMKYIKSRDPSLFAYWFATYMIVTSVVIAPKTNVQIEDVTQQLQVLKVDNVPVVFAIGAKLLTSIGFGLAQSFDMLMSMPDDMQYTKTGMLFGSHMMSAMHESRIQDSELKAEFGDYFRNCVVGDVRLLHKYSLQELRASSDISKTIFDDTSKLRRTILRDGQNVSCSDAATKIKASLDREINNGTYHSLWSRLIGQPVEKTKENPSDTSEKDKKYNDLIGRYIEVSAQEFQGLRDTSTNLLRQTLLINAIDDGVKDYQAYTNSESALVNYNYSKSQVQHRNSWIVMGKKASWFLPLQHTMLLVIMFGLFPIMLSLSITPLGGQIFKEYASFFLSLQLWPVIFSIINLAMTYYGKKHALPYGNLTIANIDQIDQVHSDIAGMAGYAMFFIPTIAYGLISKGIGSAMMHNANSMNSHTQGSAMSIASEIAGGNISVGQSSYMNTNANNLSLNKHDSNWTDMHGLSTHQVANGATYTELSDGATTYNTSGAMSSIATNIHGSSRIADSLGNSANKLATQAETHRTMGDDLLNAAASDLSNFQSTDNNDFRKGHGLSTSREDSIANDLREMQNAINAYNDHNSHSTVKGVEGFASFKGSSKDLFAGRVIAKIAGANIEAGVNGRYGKNWNDDIQTFLNSDEGQSFSNAYNHMMRTTENSNLDGSQGVNLSKAEQIAYNFNHGSSLLKQASSEFSESNQLSNSATHIREHANSIDSNLNQAFTDYVMTSHQNDGQDILLGTNIESIQKQNELADEFLSSKVAQSIISQEVGAKTSITENDLRSKHQASSEVLESNFDREKHNLESSTANNIDTLSKINNFHTMSEDDVNRANKLADNDLLNKSNQIKSDVRTNTTKGKKVINQRLNENKGK